MVKDRGKHVILFALIIATFLALACGEPSNTERSAEMPTEAGVAPTETIGESNPVQLITTPAAAQPSDTPSPAPTDTPAPTPEEDEIFLATPTPSPTPPPTPKPSPVYVTIGAVGDIMVPGGIIEDMKNEDGEYDFHPLFAPFAELFESVDLMCGNLEAPIAGSHESLSGKKSGKTGLISFNSPDSLLDALKDYGFDLLTTANNHCMDKGAKGLYRTIEVIRAAGIHQTGTYLNAEDREHPCIIEVNGIRFGFVASTRLLNHAYKDVGREEERTAIGYLTGSSAADLCEEALSDIARVKSAGAEFIIVFAHWDYENDDPTSKNTKRLARQLLEAGADCIIGSHPHRVKDAEYITVTREDGPYTGLVFYSLGNFTANQDFPLMVGLYVQLTVCRDSDGNVALYDACVMPSYNMRRKVTEGPRFTVVPAYEDPERIQGLIEPLSDDDIAAIARARALALKKLGTAAGLRVLDEPSDGDR